MLVPNQIFGGQQFFLDHFYNKNKYEKGRLQSNRPFYFKI